MKRMLNCVIMLLACNMLLTMNSCKSTPKAAATEAQTDSVDSAASTENTKMLAIDSIKFTKEAKDSSVSCKMVVDYPTGKDALDIAVRKYICQELNDINMSRFYGEPSEKKTLAYKGSLENGQEMVDFFGKENYQDLESEFKAIKVYDAQFHLQLSYDAQIRKTGETARYLTYDSFIYSFMGGAHGSTIAYSVNIDKATGKALKQTVDTTQVKALQPILRKGVLRYFKEQGEKDINEKNLGDYLFLQKGIIPLPSHAPYLAKDGVHFIYQQYEIGPYPMGMVSFVVSYQEIMPFLTAEAKKLAE